MKEYNGEYKNRYKNGQLQEQGFYKNGLLVGEYKNWWYNGRISAHLFYNKGKIIDITKYVENVNDINEHEYFHLQLVFGYFPIIKFDTKLAN